MYYIPWIDIHLVTAIVAGRNFRPKHAFDSRELKTGVDKGTERGTVSFVIWVHGGQGSDKIRAQFQDSQRLWLSKSPCRHQPIGSTGVVSAHEVLPLISLELIGMFRC